MTIDAGTLPTHIEALLFEYETYGGRSSSLWRTGQSSESQDSSQTNTKSVYQFNSAYVSRQLSWRASKRPFTAEELVKGMWVKVGDDGSQSLLSNITYSGSLKEANLFKPEESWTCSWQLVNGAFRVTTDEWDFYGVAVERAS